MKWGFDLDGVVIDVYEPIRIGLRDAFGIDFPREQHHSFKFDVPGVPGMELAKIIAEICANTVDVCEPIPGSIEALKEIARITRSPLNFITARPKDIFKATDKFLRRYLDVPYVLNMMDFIPKGQFLKDIGITHYVDDRFKEIEMAAPMVEKVFIFDSPWNRGRSFSYDNVIRISSLMQLIPYVKGWQPDATIRTNFS